MIDKPETATWQPGLQIIGAGFGRTGTLSLKAALEELGFGPCYHMTEVFQHPDHVAIWQAAANGETINWDALFANYRSTVDWPSCAFYEQLLHAYPNAKILLTVRDPESWYESVSNTIYQMRSQVGGSPLTMALSFLARTLIPGMRRRLHMLNAIIWDGTFGGNFEDKEHALAVFARHIEEVKQKVPPEKLLIYNVKEGWEPLCAFLGVAVPKNKPFPRLNDRESFVGTRRIRQGEHLAGILVLSSLLTGSLVAALFFIHRKRE